MKKNISLLRFCLLYAFVFATGICYGIKPIVSEAKQVADSTSTYQIDLLEADRARVTCRLLLKDSLLYMSRIGASQFEKRWAHFVKDLKVYDSAGNEITTTQKLNGDWILKGSKPGNPVEIRYTVLLDHEQHVWSGGIDGVAFRKPWGVFYTGRSLFVLNGSVRNDLVARFDTPAGWTVSSAWNKTEDRQNEFRVGSQEALVESMIFAGTHKEFIIEREGFELVFALGGPDLIPNSEEYLRITEGVMDYYIRLMGGIPKPSEDNPLDRVLVIINQSEQTDGEVIGNSINILESTTGDPMSVLISRFLLAHELFHLWNGKSFFPTDAQNEWFKEGVTNYYTLKSLHAVGVLNEDAMFNVLNGFFYQRYNNDDGVGKLPLTSGNEKHAHWGLIYSGGMFAGIAQDLIIRSSSQNRSSLDDLMRHLYTKYSNSNSGYSLNDLQRMCTELSGRDQQSFYKKYILGTDRLPVDHFLNSFGLEASVQDSQLKISRSNEESELESEMISGFLGTN